MINEREVLLFFLKYNYKHNFFYKKKVEKYDPSPDEDKTYKELL